MYRGVKSAMQLHHRKSQGTEAGQDVRHSHDLPLLISK